MIKQITKNTEIIVNTNRPSERYSARIIGSSKQSKPVTRATALQYCRDMQSDIDRGLIKIK